MHTTQKFLTCSYLVRFNDFSYVHRFSQCLVRGIASQSLFFCPLSSPIVSHLFGFVPTSIPSEVRLLEFLLQSVVCRRAALQHLIIKSIARLVLARVYLYFRGLRFLALLESNHGAIMHLQVFSSFFSICKECIDLTMQYSEAVIEKVSGNFTFGEP